MLLSCTLFLGSENVKGDSFCLHWIKLSNHFRKAKKVHPEKYTMSFSPAHVIEMDTAGPPPAAVMSSVVSSCQLSNSHRALHMTPALLCIQKQANKQQPKVKSLILYRGTFAHL